ncbi:PhoU domain-containing protein, partial [Planococcus sp. SIMBA_143]
MEKAQEVADLDDEVADLYGEAIRLLFQHSATEPEQLSQVTQLAFACRYMERSADYATNIAEQLFSLVRGRPYDL